jgi:ActR/RegA family two-component response regulator
VKALGVGTIKSVLVVDDDEGLRRTAMRALRPRRVVVADRIADALRLVESENVDLGIIDVHLTDFRRGGENGVELVAKLHERSPSLPLVVITGWRSGGVVDNAYQAGAARTYEKPVDWLRIIVDLEVGATHSVTSSIAIPSYQEWKREYLKKLLEATDYNVTQGARTMGVKRASLQRLLASQGLARKAKRA